jgi:hypothetical protein
VAPHANAHNFAQIKSERGRDADRSSVPRASPLTEMADRLSN